VTVRPTTDPDVLHDEERHRYELRADGAVVAVADYEHERGAIAIVHTEVAPERRRSGLAGRVVRAALNDVAASGRRVVPVCPYVVAYIHHHPEYAELVDAPGEPPGSSA